MPGDHVPRDPYSQDHTMTRALAFIRITWTLPLEVHCLRKSQVRTQHGSRSLVPHLVKKLIGCRLSHQVIRFVRRRAAKSYAGMSKLTLAWQNGIQGLGGNFGSVVWSLKNVLCSSLWQKCLLDRKCPLSPSCPFLSVNDLTVMMTIESWNLS